GLYRLSIDFLRPLNADRDLDLHRPRVDSEGSDKSQRAVMDSVLDRADRGLGVVAAVQIIAAAHLEDDALSLHRRTPSRNIEPHDRGGAGDYSPIGARIVRDFQ